MACRVYTVLQLHVSLYIALVLIYSCISAGQQVTEPAKFASNVTQITTGEHHREKREILSISAVVGTSIKAAKALYDELNAEERWAKIIITITNYSIWPLNQPIYDSVSMFLRAVYSAVQCCPQCYRQCCPQCHPQCHPQCCPLLILWNIIIYGAGRSQNIEKL